RLVYINDKIVNRDKAAVSAFDRGLLYGYGLFETMRSYGGAVFRLDRHLNRLTRSAEAIGLAPALDVPQLAFAVAQTLDANGIADARIRLTVTAGQGGRALSLPASGPLTVMIAVEELALPSPDVYSKGLSACIVSIRRNSGSPLSRMKTIGFMDNILARDEASRKGADEAILLNERGRVVECSTSNIFIVESGGLVTPPLDSGILSGVTREAVIELASQIGIEVKEETVAIERLLLADEVFITNSIIELMPVVSIDGRAVGAGGPGEMTRRLMSAYRELAVAGLR
ncbi:MAG: aminotransferase class IV, partial [Chloroflexota bacterium]|nr:aminotransferase class IV [Chloroflexota bacterium]